MIGYRWKILALMFFGSFINYIDRASLSIAAPFVMKEFSFSPAEMGVVFSSFFLSYALFCFVGGYLSDIFGPKKTIAIAMLAWSLFAAAPAIAWGLTSLIVFRVLFGASEGPFSASNNKMSFNWFPSTERAKAKGITDAGLPCGAAMAGPIIGLIAVQFGWRVSFVLLAVLGLLWTLFWLKMTSDLPRQHPKVTPEELTKIEKGQTMTANVAVVRSFFFYIKQPIILATIVAFFAYNYLVYFFLTWFPSYLVMAQNLSIKSMSIVSVIPWLLGILGFATGGIVSDHLVIRGKNPIFARKIVIIIFLSGTAISVGACGLATSATTAVTLMSIGVFCANMTPPCYWATIQDSVQGTSVGKVGGFVHFLSNLAGIFAPSITGFIIQGTGHFTRAFFITGGLAIIGAVAIAIFAKPICYTGKQEELAA